jgi:hypothetical protein
MLLELGSIRRTFLLRRHFKLKDVISDGYFAASV